MVENFQKYRIIYIVLFFITLLVCFFVFKEDTKKVPMRGTFVMHSSIPMNYEQLEISVL